MPSLIHSPPVGRAVGFTPRVWLWIGLLAALFILLHRTFLHRTILFASDPNWSHTVIVPVISAFYLFQHRVRLLAQPIRPTLWGVPLLLVGMVGYTLAIEPIRNDMVRGYMMVFTLAAMVFTLTGWRAMSVLWFPLAYLVFAVKVTDAIWTVIAAKLQTVAAVSATHVLGVLGMLLGFDASVSGNTIDLMTATSIEPHKLNVAEACSGLRMLMAFVALGTALAFLWERPWWQRLVMVAMTVPIAVLVNVGRVAILGLLHIYQPELAKGDFHLFVGMLMLIPAAGLFILLGWVMDQVMIGDDEATKKKPKPRAAAEYEPLRCDYRMLAITLAVSAAAFGLGSLLIWERDTINDKALISFGAMMGLGTLLAGLMVVFTPRDRQRMVVFGLGTGLAIVLLCGLCYGLYLNGLMPEQKRYLPMLNGTLSMIGVGLGLLVLLAMLAVMPRLLKRWLPGLPGRRTYTGLGVVTGMLLGAFASQSAAISAMGVVLIKKPVELRHSVKLIPEQAGPWKMVYEEPELSPEILDALGTRHYFTRHYLDTTQAQPENFNYSPQGGQWVFTPGSVVRLHMTYYTGKPDLVPHVPDNCFVGAGLINKGRTPGSLSLDPELSEPDPSGDGLVAESQLVGEVPIPGLDVPVSVLAFVNPKQSNAPEQYVLYFFLTNGEYARDRLKIRATAAEPRSLYHYYAKVEIQLPGTFDREQLLTTASDAMSHLMPEIMAALPDWRAVEAGTYPEVRP